ncbi:hypothetical protein [Pseudosporangium ferrugineum]|uniref:Putative HAF family extracellular repeat protein n=1 Tax=Pseudosporangium ferrugineum TaxID=439699 RepID=A0A2T0SG20_9ACTN|nr:hypothetical protein [Pseudosporangium ferrugineum]PRY32368.1 putative HAF family extracellular repeat protein [Pseudosporangium ferrugineum]
MVHGLWSVATAVAAVTIAGTPAVAGAPVTYHRTVTLGTLGGASSAPQGLNDERAVVGWAETGDGRTHPFLWRDGRMTDLGTLDDGDGGWGIAAAVNRWGTVAGQSRGPAGTRAVRWQNGGITDLGTLGGDYSFATAINDSGTIAGASTTPDGSLHAFVWRRGTMTDLGVPGAREAFAEDIDNRGRIVGWRAAGDGTAAAYLWERGTVTFLPALGQGGRARAINERGDVAGAVLAGGSSRAARWRGTHLELLGNLPGGNAAGALAVNDDGVILGVGNVAPGSAEDHAFLWRHGTLVDLSTSGVPNSAVGLDDRLEIIGTVPNAAGDGPLAALFVPAG